MATATSTISDGAAAALCNGSLSEQQAEAIYEQGKEAVVFTLLAVPKQLAEAQGKTDPSVTPSTPSGMIPTDEKPPAKGRGKKRPGGKLGHPRSRRPVPEQIDGEETPRAKRCLDCNSRLKRCHETRTRYVEDIPPLYEILWRARGDRAHDSSRLVPQCKKKVEAPVPDALPDSQLDSQPGSRVLVLSAWLHDALGNTLSQVVEVFNFPLQMKLTEGGLVDMWSRLQAILFAWSEQIQQEALDSAPLFASAKQGTPTRPAGV